MEKPVLLEIEDRIALITLNRPEIHNAINGELLRHLITSLMEVKSNDEIRVAILTGKGKSFCSGADLNWMRGVIKQSYQENLDESNALANLFYQIKEVECLSCREIHICYSRCFWIIENLSTITLRIPR